MILSKGRWCWQCNLGHDCLNGSNRCCWWWSMGDKCWRWQRRQRWWVLILIGVCSNFSVLHSTSTQLTQEFFLFQNNTKILALDDQDGTLEMDPTSAVVDTDQWLTTTTVSLILNLILLLNSIFPLLSYVFCFIILIFSCSVDYPHINTGTRSIGKRKGGEIDRKYYDKREYNIISIRNQLSNHINSIFFFPL